MNIYKRYSQFISTDPRSSRTGNSKAYKIDSVFMQDRHDSFFYNYDLKNKSILDIGCCVGATGAYVLDKGAKFYHGVEYDQDLVNIASKNLEQAFSKDLWNVEQGTLEEFSKESKTHYDIIVLSGVVYAVFDCIPILIDLSKHTDAFIIDGIHPDFANNIPEQVSNVLKQFNLWENFLENASFVEHTYMPMSINKHVLFHGSRQSFGFIKNFLTSLGFKNANIVNDQLKNKIPYLYNSYNRYGERFEKISDKKGLGYVGIQ
jgi:16S rRNA G966 N2-methylase RsmD